ncbi:hypothetical protein DRW41_19820 [Neobacillus piezotolerans]|uniref:Uncharacterized protein n=1 Tax=Neobacillus piezotolerans TaxID=2259171 RepID=A0A3D8GLI6_9BACI|nr:hypothetical protein DRW41_19820 [Neobacillus piezotolerans]
MSKDTRWLDSKVHSRGLRVQRSAMFGQQSAIARDPCPKMPDVWTAKCNLEGSVSEDAQCLDCKVQSRGLRVQRYPMFGQQSAISRAPCPKKPDSLDAKLKF